jgi:hypothetical protein
MLVYQIKTIRTEPLKTLSSRRFMNYVFITLITRINFPQYIRNSEREAVAIILTNMLQLPFYYYRLRVFENRLLRRLL